MDAREVADGVDLEVGHERAREVAVGRVELEHVGVEQHVEREEPARIELGHERVERVAAMLGCAVELQRAALRRAEDGGDLVVEGQVSGGRALEEQRAEPLRDERPRSKRAHVMLPVSPSSVKTLRTQTIPGFEAIPMDGIFSSR
jgi:hypothetical protein